MSRVRRWLPALLLVVAAWPAWHACLELWFVSDSFMLPLLLEGTREVAWERVWADLWGSWMGIEGLDNWRPLVTLHYALDLWVWGPSPLALHLSNLAVHLLTGLVLFALLRRLLPGLGLLAPWVAAWLYLVHPARVEAVAWIPGRVDVTAALPAVLAAWAFVRAGWRREAWGWTALSLGAALLAYGAKEMALALPATLFLVGLLRRDRAWLPAWGAHLALLAGVVALRFHLFGALVGGEGGEGLVAGGLTTLPTKLRLAFAPPLEAVPTGARWAIWVGLPLLAGALRGRALLAAWPVPPIYLAALVPASAIAVSPDFGGSRVLLLPALTAAILYTHLLGPVPGEHNTWPRGTVRWVAAGLLLPLALVGTWERLDAWRTAGENARTAVAQVEALPPAPGRGPLGVVTLPGPAAGVDPFRYDVAFLAFRRPFAEADREVVILQNTMQKPLMDGGALRQAALFCRALVAWNPQVGGFRPLPLARGAPPPLTAPGLAVNPAGRLAAPRQLTGAEWLWTELGPRRGLLDTAGVELHLEAPAPGFEARLCWSRGGGPVRVAAGGVPGAGPGGGEVSFLPLDASRRRWVAPAGNRLAWGALGLAPHPVPLALATRGAARLVGIRFLARLPRAGWRPEGLVVVDPGQPQFPVPPGFRGPCRLVLFTPGEVMEHFYTGRGQGRITVPDTPGRGVVEVLRFLARVAPDAPYYFSVDRLATPGDRYATLNRTRVFVARHGAGTLGRRPKNK